MKISQQLLMVAALLLALHAQADTLLGKVTIVADGDTITVQEDSDIG